MLVRPDNLAVALVDSLQNRQGDIVLSVDCEDISGSEFLSRSAGRQKQLANAGLKLGDRIFIQGGRGSLFWSDFLAVWGMGGVAIPLSPAISLRDFSIQRTKAEAAGFIGRQGEIDSAGLAVIEDSPTASSGELSVLPMTLDDEAAILFTSGSSGEPKGVRLSHRSVLGNAIASTKAIGFRATDSLFIAIGFHFTSAICHFLAAILSRGKLTATERPMLQGEMYAALTESGCNSFGGAPVQLRWIARCAREDPIKLGWIMSSGDRLPRELIDDLKAVLPETKIHTFYGLTELGGRFCALPAEKIATHAGSVGRPIEGMSVRIAGDQGESLPPDTLGEITASGEYLFTDYLNDPEKTSLVFDGNELRTGDVGYLDKEGFLYVEGRNDDVFKVSGRKVSALVVQQALMDCGIFEDVAVVQFEDPELGSIARALYSLKKDGTFRRGKILGILRKNLPKHFLPALFTEVPSVPRTGSGKLDRRALKKLMYQTDKIE